MLLECNMGYKDAPCFLGKYLTRKLFPSEFKFYYNFNFITIAKITKITPILIYGFSPQHKPSKCTKSKMCIFKTTSTKITLSSKCIY